MTAYAIVTGALFKPPERRTSKVGKSFVTTTIRTKDGEAAQWWSVVAFSEGAQAELMRLDAGDAATVQGPIKIELYAKDGGEQKISLSVVADQALALRQPPKERAISPPGSKATQRDAWRPGDGPDDEIPFGGPR